MRPELVADDTQQLGARRSSVGRQVAFAVAALVGCVVVVATVAWWTNGVPGERHVWPAVGADVIVGFVLVVLGWRVVDRLWIAGPALLVIVAVGGWLGAAVMPSWAVRQRIRAAQPGLDNAVRRLIDGGTRPCFDPTGPDKAIGPMADVDQICVVAGPGQVRVSITSGPEFRGLVYLVPGPRNPELVASDQCVYHLDGPWWEVAAYTTDIQCPAGFTGTGGG